MWRQRSGEARAWERDNRRVGILPMKNGSRHGEGPQVDSANACIYHIYHTAPVDERLRLAETVCGKVSLAMLARLTASSQLTYLLVWSPRRGSGIIGFRKGTPERDLTRGGEAVTFKEVLTQVIDWLQQDKRLSYRALKRQFDLDDDYLDDLKAELIEVRRIAVEEDGRVLVWTGNSDPVPAAEPPPQAPLVYTPPYLAEKILTSKSALEGERKQVTVLFADLKGSMELLADRDPEEARQLLDPVLERMMEAVHRYEGTVNQVMGDGIMALFGAPIAHEDHAVRACYAGL